MSKLLEYIFSAGKEKSDFLFKNMKWEMKNTFLANVIKEVLHRLFNKLKLRDGLGKHGLGRNKEEKTIIREIINSVVHSAILNNLDSEQKKSIFCVFQEKPEKYSIYFISHTINYIRHYRLVMGLYFPKNGSRNTRMFINSRELEGENLKNSTTYMQEELFFPTTYKATQISETMNGIFENFKEGTNKINVDTLNMRTELIILILLKNKHTINKVREYFPVSPIVKSTTGKLESFIGENP